MKWSETSLSTVLIDSQSGTWGSPPQKDGMDFPVLRSTNIHDSALVLDDVAYRSISEKSAKRYQLLDGDIIVTTSSGSKYLIGKNALFRQPENGQRYLFSNFTLRLRPREDVIIPRYLHLYLNSSKAKAVLFRLQSTTSGLRNLPVPLYLAQVVPLPTRSEQRRIVEILDQADALRKKRAEADKTAERILLTLFFKLFGSPLTNLMGWDTVTLDSKCEIVTGNTPSTKIPEYYGEHTRWARPADLNNQILVSKTEKMLSEKGREVARLVPANSVLVVCIGATLGKVALTAVDMAINQQINAILPSQELLPEFLYIQCVLLAERFMAASTKSTLPILNKSRFGNQMMICPPKEKQEAFSRAARILISSHDARATSNKKLESLYQSLLHRAFTGDLTAKWRERHMKELLAEMELQSKALKLKEDDDAIEVISNRHGGHDMFNKAAFASYITYKCHSPQHPMGRVKLAKLYYLAQRKAEMALTEAFAKRVAGPLDDDIHKFLSLAQKKKWVSFGRGKGDLKPVNPGRNVQEAVEQVGKRLGHAIYSVDTMIDQMKGWSWKALERWATVLDAAEEIISSSKKPTVQSIKEVIQKYPAWKDKLKRNEFSDENIASTLKGLHNLGFISNNSDQIIES